MNDAGTETYFDKPAVIEALQYWVDLSGKYKVHPAGIIEWGTTPKDFFESKVAMIWTTTGNLTNMREQRQVRVRRRDAAGEQAARQPDRRRQLLHLQEGDAGAAGGGVQVRQVDDVAARAAQWSIDTGYVAVPPDAWETPAMKKYVARSSAPPPSRATSCSTRWPSSRRTTTSA